MVDARRFLCAAAIAGSALLPLVAGLDAAPARAASAEDQVAHRQDEMKKQGKAIKALMTFAKGQGGTLAEVAQNAEIIHQISLTVPDLFPAGTAVGVDDSGAKPEIWTEGDHFKQLAAAVTKESATLSQLARAASADPAAVSAQVAAVGKACGACHESYRARKN